MQNKEDDIVLFFVAKPTQHDIFYGREKLNAFYSKFPDFERSLLTNINLSLMFSQMSAEAFEIFK